MKNRILYLTRTSIPYVKELQPIAHSLGGCILMQQLDYWFERKPTGFYKFLEPCPHQFYRAGESWVEELGLSAVEFRTTFDRFGIRYKSKSEFDASPDKFQGKFYCSYHDKRAQLTWYFRNHELLDKALDNLLMSQNHTETPQNGGQNGEFRPTFPVSTPPAPPAPTVSTGRAFTVATPTVVTVNAACEVPRSEQDAATGNAGNADPVAPGIAPHEQRQASLMDLRKSQSGITENNKDFQTLLPQRSSQLGEGNGCGGSSFVDNLVFPEKVSPEERQVLGDLLEGCPDKRRQEVLDEIEGYIRNNKITAGVVPLGRSLVRAVASGSFTPNHGVVVLASREAHKRQAQAQSVARSTGPDATWDGIDDDTLRKLPPTFRQKAEQNRKREGR